MARPDRLDPFPINSVGGRPCCTLPFGRCSGKTFDRPVAAALFLKPSVAFVRASRIILALSCSNDYHGCNEHLGALNCNGGFYVTEYPKKTSGSFGATGFGTSH
jgi:hypothetical protein